MLISADAASAAIVRSAMHEEGFDVLECARASEGMDLVLKSVPAFVVIDSDLADGDSIQLCKELRAHRKLRYVPIILTTDDEDRSALRLAYDAGFTTVIDKPLTIDSLRQRFRSFGDTGRTITGLQSVAATGTTGLMRVVPDAFFEVSAKGVVRKHLGGGDQDPLLQPSQLQGKTFKDVWPRSVSDLIMRNVRRTLATRDGYDFEFELSDNSSCSRYEMRLLVQGRDRVLAIVRNVTTSPSADSAAGRLATDTLTGLATLDAFQSELETIVADARMRERGLAVMCIDIDRFSQINNSLGRKVGDTVLAVSAKRIEHCLREVDHVSRLENATENSELARIGGDEFVLVLTGIESRSDVSVVADRVQLAFEEPVKIENHALEISPSIGIAVFPVDGSSAELLLENARTALSEAKTHGVNGREFHSDTIKFRALQRFDLIDELRWAIEKEQLHIHYLPRIDLVSGRVREMEALLRWEHPLRGDVPLHEVIPLAQATGLILPIGEWILTTACNHGAHWAQQDSDAPCVSVNLSQDEFSRDDLPELVQDALSSSGLAASRLQLELTEAMLMRHRRAEVVLGDLKKIGVRLVIDDFGTGHSSFANLRALPIDAVKIDRSFVGGSEEAGDRQSICAAIIAMAHELGLGVIAEGVETDEQLQFLRERGCDAAQGFLYTKPMPAERVLPFLAEHASGPALSIVSG